VRLLVFANTLSQFYYNENTHISSWKRPNPDGSVPTPDPVPEADEEGPFGRCVYSHVHDYATTLNLSVMRLLLWFLFYSQAPFRRAGVLSMMMKAILFMSTNRGNHHGLARLLMTLLTRRHWRRDDSSVDELSLSVSCLI
jgi:hypothetical protein